MLIWNLSFVICNFNHICHIWLMIAPAVPAGLMASAAGRPNRVIVVLVYRLASAVINFWRILPQKESKKFR